MTARATTRQKLAWVVLGGVLLLGACSGGSDDRATSTTSNPAKKKTDDTTAMCAVFQGIADRAAATGGQPSSGPGGGGPAQPTTKEGWDERIKQTAKIVDTVPADYRDEATTYLQLVKDRAQLAADNGYALVADLPGDVRNAFIRDHAAAQQQANKLIAFAKSTCNLR